MRVALFVLLAFMAGGDRFAPMGMDLDQGSAQVADMQACKACDAMMADMPGDAVCAALPGTEGTTLAFADVRLAPDWITRSDSGVGTTIRPDASPPRA